MMMEFSYQFCVEIIVSDRRHIDTIEGEKRFFFCSKREAMCIVVGLLIAETRNWVDIKNVE